MKKLEGIRGWLLIYSIMLVSFLAIQLIEMVFYNKLSVLKITKFDFMPIYNSITNPPDDH